jgi:hypothetical protein
MQNKNWSINTNKKLQQVIGLASRGRHVSQVIFCGAFCVLHVGGRQDVYVQDLDQTTASVVGYTYVRRDEDLVRVDYIACIYLRDLSVGFGRYATSIATRRTSAIQSKRHVHWWADKDIYGVCNIFPPFSFLFSLFFFVVVVFLFMFDYYFI